MLENKWRNRFWWVLTCRDIYKWVLTFCVKRPRSKFGDVCSVFPSDEQESLMLSFTLIDYLENKFDEFSSYLWEQWHMTLSKWQVKMVMFARSRGHQMAFVFLVCILFKVFHRTYLNDEILRLSLNILFVNNLADNTAAS